MQKLVLVRKLFLAFIVTVSLLTSCTSSRYAGGFGYHPASKAPDIATGNNKAAVKEEPGGAIEENATAPTTVNEEKLVSDISQEMRIKMSTDEQKKFTEIDKTFREEWKARNESGEATSNRELMASVTKKLTENGTIEKLSQSETKKLDRLALKMDRKMLKQGKEIDATHNTNLELFFLIMAVAGLVLGILGIWLGWLLLVVFGGLWLYYKLVKD